MKTIWNTTDCSITDDGAKTHFGNQGSRLNALMSQIDLFLRLLMWWIALETIESVNNFAFSQKNRTQISIYTYL